MKITICTPTYNRGKLLHKLYESLQTQTFSDFEWIIVDDGSNDDTERIVGNFIKDNKVEIRYIRKKNGGKHTALNRGILDAKGELFWIVDSDDYIVRDILQWIWQEWLAIKNKNDYAGIAGLRAFTNYEIIGDTIPNEYLDVNYLMLRYKYHIKGDKAEIYVTNILKKYLFPEFEGEKYVTEAVIWNRIANDGYKLRWCNKITYICEYLEGGLTNTSDSNIMASWKGTTLYYKELLGYKQVSLKDKMMNGARGYLHYCYLKGIGLKGILDITYNHIYILIAAALYTIKLLKRYKDRKIEKYLK